MSEKKKILTITCHNVYNHGATLQEFALLYFLNSQGFDVATINYKPEYLSGHFKLWTVSNPKYDIFPVKYLYLMAKLPGRLRDLKRKRNFDRFEKKHIKTSVKKYKSNKELKNNPPQADVYICGSDQIWNPLVNNGKDPAFYLDFVPKNKIKISYAASFSTDKIPDDLVGFVKNKVKSIHKISVRETSGVEILKKLNFDQVTQVLDPVFLLDKNEWNKFSNKKMKPNEPYLLVYDADKNPKIAKLALKISKEKKWKIYSISKGLNYADKSFYLEGPDSFLSLIKNAKYIISNSFHAAAFSVIYNKQFVVFDRKENINTRMRDFTNLLMINNVMLDYDADVDSFNRHYTINYKTVNERLDKYINESKRFLLNSLRKN